MAAAVCGRRKSLDLIVGRLKNTSQLFVCQPKNSSGLIATERKKELFDRSRSTKSAENLN
jgi:hypothetical protein